MKRINTKITYLYHSGFTVETDNKLLVFDFYQGNIRPLDKQTYIFVTHGHPDHYNPEIFAWQNKQPDIKYILSFDICDDANIPPENHSIIFISPDKEKQIDDIEVKAYGSTDEGVSFLVRCDGINIFHAGDLNWWCWAEDTSEGKTIAEEWFKAEIAKIKGECIDIAFFPVDPRLEQNYYLGAELFINEIKPRYFIPMHFWDDYKLIAQFKDMMKDSSTQIIAFTHKGQERML